MNKKSLLATAVALVLAGCGSDDSGSSSSNPSTPQLPTTTNKFIDAAVEGIYYSTSSGLTGVTDSEGQFNARLSDTVTFYIGGENGLKVGAASNRDVLTPFEAAGKYDRAVNLAILLQSLDNQFGSASDDILTIPEGFRNPDPISLAQLKDLSLDDQDSVEAFLEEVGVTAENIVSEEHALTHMDEAFGSMERGVAQSNPFLEIGKYVRYIDVTQNIDDPYSGYSTYVHADLMMEDELFERTRGMTEMTFLVNAEDSVTKLKGSNDYSIADSRAEQYLACVAESLEWDDDEKVCESIPSNPTAFGLMDHTNNKFAYKLRDSNKSSSEDKLYIGSDIEGWKPFDAENVSQLNHYAPNNVWNDGSSEQPKWIRDTTSGSYDPITEIYTEIVKKEILEDEDSVEASRTTERVAYYYEVESASQERYVDFTGTWKTTGYCDNGEIATFTMTFDDTGAVLDGDECSGNPTVPERMEDSGTHYTFAELKGVDYWWFAQTGRESKATLTELNTVVRFCDQSSYDAEKDNCNDYNEYFVKWEYQPAGSNWDEGLLIRRKMDRMGSTDGRVSIMQKID
ncbi:hypothetical protein [Vibrio maerlii]|uniref:hypothetical protein n=1 Tax=Vibrio maerlii TaxID=2231648 RepID=UPI000E3CE2E6|nr:hypothetical protein [Vibrio maerlii]